MKGPNDIPDEQPQAPVEDLKVGRDDPAPADNQMLRDAVGRALGLNNFNDIKANQDQLTRLIEWAQAKGAKNPEEYIWNIKELGNRIGASRLGESWARHLSVYAGLELQRLQLDKELRKMEA